MMCSYASIVPSDTEVETILVEHVMESSAMDYPDDEVDSHQSLDHSCDHSSYVSLAEALSAVGQQHDPLSDISNIDGGKSLLVSQKKDAPGPTNMELFSASREVATKWLEMGKLDALIATSCNAASGSPAVDYYCTPSQGQIKYIDVPKQPRDDVSCVNGTGCSPLTVDSSLSVSLPLGDTGRLVGGSSADNFGARSHRSDDPPDSLIDPVRSEQAFEIFQRAGFGCPRRHRREELLLHPKGRPRGPVSRGRQQCESKTIGTSTTLTPGRSHTQRPAPVPVATLVVDSPCRSTRRPRNSLLLQQRELPALEPGSWHPTVPLKSVSSRDPEPSISLPFPRSHSGRFAGNTMAGSHWKSAQDPRTGRTYYYHETTRETQWRKPPELASEAEKKAMEEKERKQKDFFAAMEANILNSLSQGQVPGTPKTQDTLERRRSSRKPAERPELVRTISTMDDIVLKNLIQRQPSFRNIKQNALSKTASLNPGDFEVSKRSSHIATSDFESFVSIMSDHQRLDPLHESMISNDDSMPELFNYLPDEGEFSMGESIVSIEDGHRGNNESNETSYGLTREEAQALKKLASITKEMIDVEKEDIEFVDLPKKGAAGATPSWRSKDAKGMRDLPREIELDESDDDDDDDDESDRPDQKANTAPLGAFQKAKDIGGRELDFDSDEEDDETTSDMAPTPMQKKTAEEKKDINVKKKDPTMERPEVKRRNTCGTLYVGTTMSAPDKDATIKCVCGVVRTHILSSESWPHDSSDDEFRVFNDFEAHQAGRLVKFHKNGKQPQAQVPSLDEVTKFYRDIFYKAQMESDCIIMSLIYVERLVKRTGGKLRPRAKNWRSLLFSCMILSSKVWDDLSMWNADFSQSCPPGVAFPLKRINQLELAVLHALSFQVKVPASEYAKYYFLLRSMLIKSGLGGENLNALDPLDVMGARRLQQVSSQFENLSLESKSSALSQRSKSLSVAAIKAKQPAKLGLEQVVKM